jgi:hypothetical protein
MRRRWKGCPSRSRLRATLTIENSAGTTITLRFPLKADE